MHQVMQLPGLALILAITALTMSGHYSFFTYVAPFLLHAGLTAAAIGPVLLGCGTLGVLGSRCAAHRGRRAHRPRAARTVARSPTAAIITPVRG
jgi:predicted MFS family arabinose efflux permease